MSNVNWGPIYQVNDAGHDKNGNPKRITVKYSSGGKVIGKHVDRYDGDGIPRGAKALPTLKITNAMYQALKRSQTPEF